MCLKNLNVITIQWLQDHFTFSWMMFCFTDVLMNQRSFYHKQDLDCFGKEDYKQK